MPADFPSLPLVRAGRRGRCPVDAIGTAHLDFLRGGLRCEVFVEGARVGLLDVRLHDATDDDRLMTAEAAADADRIALANGAMRLGRFTVHFELAALARALCLGACLEEAGDIQPDV